MSHTNDMSTEFMRLTSEEMKTINGGLKAQWMDGEETDPEAGADLKALWMDEA